VALPCLAIIRIDATINDGWFQLALDRLVLWSPSLATPTESGRRAWRHSPPIKISSGVVDDGRRRPGASRWIRSASDVASRFCPGQVDRRFRVRAASLCSPTAYSYRCVLSTRARRPASKSVAVLCSDDDDERISARSARASGSGMLLRLTPSFRDGWHPPGDNYWFNKMTSDGYSNLWLALAY
jgi:hypothetical protein